jgi:hypothetical protein
MNELNKKLAELDKLMAGRAAKDEAIVLIQQALRIIAGAPGLDTSTPPTAGTAPTSTS